MQEKQTLLKLKVQLLIGTQTGPSEGATHCSEVWCYVWTNYRSATSIIWPYKIQWIKLAQHWLVRDINSSKMWEVSTRFSRMKGIGSCLCWAYEGLYALWRNSDCQFLATKLLRKLYVKGRKRWYRLSITKGSTYYECKKNESYHETNSCNL